MHACCVPIIYRWAVAVQGRVNNAFTPVRNGATLDLCIVVLKRVCISKVETTQLYVCFLAVEKDGSTPVPVLVQDKVEKLRALGFVADKRGVWYCHLVCLTNFYCSSIVSCVIGKSTILNNYHLCFLNFKSCAFLGMQVFYSCVGNQDWTSVSFDWNGSFNYFSVHWSRSWTEVRVVN